MDRFAILEHCWNGVHWDLMLERGAMLKTWALDEELAPGRQVSARALADHRRVYLDYEGPVSGDRGTVRRVDAGRYETLAWADANRVVVRLDGARFRGVLELDRNVTPGMEGRWTALLGKVDSSSR